MPTRQPLDSGSGQEILIQMEGLVKNFGKLEVLKGIEMGILPGGTMARCEAAAQDYAYDFILASFHATPERTFDDLARDPASNVEGVFRQYYEFVLSCIGQFKNYDVLAHLNLVDRYAPYVPDDSLYTDVIDEILRTAVSDGKGLEIGFNNKYLMDALKAAPADRVRLELSTGVSPCVILPDDGGDNFLYMVLPVRLKAGE